MNKYLMIGAALAVVAAYWLHDRLGQPPAMAAQTEPGRDLVTLSAQSTQSQPAATQPTTESYDDGTEVVLGLRVRKDRNCTVELKDYVTPDGEMFKAYSCTPHSPRPPHPYESYSDATLKVMAYSDAEAAALLGKRLLERDTGRSYEMLIRAAALDNDFTHLAWLGDQAFGLVAINGVPQIDNLKRQYELAALSQYFGEYSGRRDFYRRELSNAGIGADEIASLDERVAELLRQVQDIQRTVHGTVTVGGPNDA